MSGGWKDIVKSGWHPEKDGTSLKSQVKGLVGRGDSSSSTARENHVVTPRSALRDPSSFGPPPKRVGTNGPTAAAPSQTTYATPQAQTQPIEQEEETEIEGGERPPSPKPYRVNTTGLSTSHLPPPPTRSSKGVSEGRNHPLQSPAPTRSPTRTPIPSLTTTAASSKPKPPPPSLPPRLPARTNGPSNPPIPTPTPIGVIQEATGAQQTQLNQNAITRLGAAGISVPGLGIGTGGGFGGGGAGGNNSTTGSTSTTPPPPPSRGPGNGQVDELQSRFAQMGGAAASSSSLRSGVSSGNSTGTGTTAAAAELVQRQVPSVVGKKKPPPPPIAKKPGLSLAREGQGQGQDDAPPPIPLATRPRFD